MPSTKYLKAFEHLQSDFEGHLYFNSSVSHNAQKLLYATDASVYQEKPTAVAIPKTVEDIQKLIHFATENKLTLIPRAAGTSLAGQVVGNGIVVDISKYFTQILELNINEKWVRVQPGVIRDDLNAYLKPFGLMFGPETSTSSRAMIGGMIGNNSCGLHSIIWGTTRDNLLSAKVLLSDASEIELRDLKENELKKKLSSSNSTETRIYQNLFKLLAKKENQDNIRNYFPKPSVSRRNMGYALDFLVDSEPFLGKKPFNLCKLLAGSEGTLAFITEAKLQLIDLPPQEMGLVCVQCHSLKESLQANRVAMQYSPSASELVDKQILDFTIGHPEYHKCRFFIEKDPEAILIVEFTAHTPEELQAKAEALTDDLKQQGLGYAHPFITGDNTKLVWDVRKGGLGLLRNQPGDLQPVNLIEDCAVALEDLPDYIEDIEKLLAKHNTRASYYAHAGAGELHVEPLINLKTSEGKLLFRTILQETTGILKKYNGSLSGEHGDGRLRGEFIETMVGAENYALFKTIKNTFDPNKIFNAGKITDTPPMNEFLRYKADAAVPKIATVFDFSKQEGILKLAEKCSGSGDCRKTEVTGGTMCPSYMATRLEKDTTRARANVLRQFLTEPQKSNPFDHPEIKEVMDLCLSCKGCKSECPSGVDVGKMKAEFLQHYYDAHGASVRTRLIGGFSKINRLVSIAPNIYNYLITNEFFATKFKDFVGFAQERSIPLLGKFTFRSWYEKAQKAAKKKEGNSKYFAPVQIGKKKRTKKVYLFCDEFTNYNDVEIGIKAYQLLTRLGYEVIIPAHIESGRTYLSKGLVRAAGRIAAKNVRLLTEAIKDNSPIIGIEPSAILTLRDEYIDLVPSHIRPDAERIAENAYLFEEFFAQEIDKKNITKKQFTQEKRLIKLHGHCHQKALSSMIPVKKMLGLPENYEVQLIPSGCCGMAGAFGYETEHYEVSMQIGELVLFPTIRKQAEDTIIAASGTSCRHQIKDGTGRIAQHPIEILWEAMV